MRLDHIAILIGWSVVMIGVTGLSLFAFSFGDCLDEIACSASKNRTFDIILGLGFVAYWSVFIHLIRRWSR